MADYVTYTIKDGKGALSKVVLYWGAFGYPPPLNFVSLMEAGVLFTRRLDAVIDGQIIACTFSTDLAFQGDGYPGIGPVKLAPDPASDVEDGAKFIFTTEGGFQRVIRIPTFKEAFRLPSGAVNVEDPDVAALITALIEGIDTGTAGMVAPTVSQYAMGDARRDKIASLKSAREDFAPRR